MQFELRIPTRIIFGNGVLEDGLNKAVSDAFGIVMIIASGSAQRTGTLDRVIKCLRSRSGIDNVLPFLGISANPKVEEVNRGIAVAIENNARLIVGLGGGSAIDAAKAIAAGAGACEPIDRFFYDGVMPGENTLPIIAIPTTAGTGSELSKSGILSSVQRKIKTGIRSEYLYPKVAIVDPELTYTLPRDVTMETGFDVFAHAVESYISKASNCFTEALSEKAIVIVSKNLRRLSLDLTDCGARECMSYASMIMGINLGNASTALPHRMQYPIGALTDTSHGMGLAALYPAWVELTYQYSPDKFNRVGELLSGHACHTVEDVLRELLVFMDMTCRRPMPNRFGIGKKDARKLSSMVTGNIGLDPAGNIESIVQRIYEKAAEYDG